MLYQLAQLHGAVHNSRLDEVLCINDNTTSQQIPYSACNLVMSRINCLVFLFCFLYVGVLTVIQKYFDISDSTAGLLQTGMMMHHLHILTQHPLERLMFATLKKNKKQKKPKIVQHVVHLLYCWLLQDTYRFKITLVRLVTSCFYKCSLLVLILAGFIICFHSLL